MGLINRFEMLSFQVITGGRGRRKEIVTVELSNNKEEVIYKAKFCDLTEEKIAKLRLELQEIVAVNKDNQCIYKFTLQDIIMLLQKYEHEYPL